MGVIQRQGIKNTISSYSGILIGFVSLLVIQPSLLTAEEIGLARVLFAFSTLISTIIPFGITHITIKYFPLFRNTKNGHNGFLGFVLLFFLVGFIFSAIGLWIFREFIIAQYRNQSPLVIHYYNYIFPFSFFLALVNVLTHYLIALYKSTASSYLADVGVRVLYILLILLYHFNFLTLEQFLSGFVGIYAFQALALVAYVSKVDNPTLNVHWNYLKKVDYRAMLSFGLLLSLGSVASLGLKTLDAVFLGKYRPLDFVGVYTIAAFIPTIIEAPLNALDRIVSASVSYAYSDGRQDDLRDVFYKSVRYLSLIGGLLFVGVNTNIFFLLSLVGKEYTQGVEVVYIISAGSLLTMFGGSSSPLLIYTSKPWQGALMLLMLVAITVVTNMLLIPRFGINGAAMSTAISAVLFTAGKFILNYRRLGFQPYGISTLKILFIVVLCFACNYSLPVLTSEVFNILLRSVLMGSLYLVLVYVFKLLPEFHRYLPWHKSN
jgi:O-antigen/teichoic acid export membrane protein